MSLAHNHFIDLLEGMLSEASTSMDILRQVPGADKLIAQLHRDKHTTLGHDQTYEPLPDRRPPWNELKAHKQSVSHWVLVQGPLGAGVIYAPGSGDDYKVMASWPDDPADIHTKYTASGGEVLQWLTDFIGKPTAMWLGKDRKTVDTKRAQRRQQRAVPAEPSSPDDIAELMLQRFKPLWLRSIRGAQADIKGWINTQLKSDSYEKASNKLTAARMLNQIVHAIEAGDGLMTGDARELMMHAIRTAVNLTTAHYYPELAGEWRQRYAYSSYGARNKYEVSNRDAIQQLYTDIRAGDTRKLGTVLAYFRNQLVRI